MLSIVATSLLAFQQPASNLMKLRGGMGLGPITPGNFDGALKVAAAMTVASAVSQKYADLGDTALGKTFTGDTWTTNVVISMATGVASTVIYSVSASPFDTAKLTACLWLASVVVKLKDADWDLSSLKDAPVEKAIAVIAGLLAFA